MQLLSENAHYIIDQGWYRPAPAQVSIEDMLRAVLDAAQTNGSERIDYEVCVDERSYRLRITALEPVLPRKRSLLSQREQEIISLIAQGMPNKQIARRLNISASTVGTYAKRIFLKLNVGSRAEMVSKVLREGLLDD